MVTVFSLFGLLFPARDPRRRPSRVAGVGRSLRIVAHRVHESALAGDVVGEERPHRGVAALDHLGAVVANPPR